jgi:hypothetical protein
MHDRVQFANNIFQLVLKKGEHELLGCRLLNLPDLLLLFFGKQAHIYEEVSLVHLL